MEWIIILLCAIVLILVVLMIFVVVSLKKKSTINQIIVENKTTDLIPTENEDILLAENFLISAVSEIILNNNQGQALTLKRSDDITLSNKKYTEIIPRGSSALANVAQGTMPTISQAQTISEIAKNAPNGLFTATAPINDLMKYKDCTIGSIVMRDGIAKHSGFKEVALNVANPAAVVGASMQAMALVSSQYYMHQLTTQMKTFGEKLDKLAELHHGTKFGILNSVNKRVIELTSKINVDAADIIAIQRQKEKVDEIYFEYLGYLDDTDINDIIGVKKRWLNKTKEMRDLGENLNKEELGFNIQMCYHASVLAEKCTLTEVAIRLKMKGQEGILEELCEKLKSEYDEHFHRRAEHYISERYAPIIDKATEIGSVTEKILSNTNNASESVLPLELALVLTGGKYILTKQVEKNAIEIEHLESRKNELLEMATSSSQTVEELVSLIESPKEILYVPGENPGEYKMFVEETTEITGG